MFEDIECLYEDILYATEDTDCIFENLKNIKDPTICIGVGGSKVVAKFAEKVLAKKNKIIAITMEPHSFRHFDANLFKNIILASHSGKNYGIKTSLENNLNKYLLSTKELPNKDEILLKYNMIERKSFISISDTIIPMAILLKYYLGSKYHKTLTKIFANIDSSIILKGEENINIFTGIDTETASTFLESTLIESGLNVPIINYKYDYCHGRSTINKHHNNESIILGYSNTDLDKKLKGVLLTTTKKVLVLKKISQDDIINDFYLTCACVYLCANIAKSKKVNLKKIEYDRDAVHELYYFKGSM